MNVRTGKSVELMHVTGGYHYHTVRADNEAVLDRIEAALSERNNGKSQEVKNWGYRILDLSGAALSTEYTRV